MSDSKINIKIGHVEFSGEGNQEWLGSQLDKILEKIPELLKIELGSPNGNGQSEENGGGQGEPKGTKTGTLASWLRSKNATVNQTKKFLATAAFLQLGGKERLTTQDVSESLKKYNQGKLGNPSESLNQNVGKGHCEKDGKQFYVTPEGFEELGIKVE
jgi:hypothetical protein